MAAFPGTGPSGGTLVSTETVTGGVVPPSAAHTFGAAGTFYWAAFYSGDASNQAAASPCVTEPLVVTPAPSQVTTELSATDGEIVAGGTASDAATLAGVTGTAAGSWRTGSTGRCRRASSDAAAFPGTAPSGGTLVSTETGDQRRGAGLGRAHVRRRGHLLLGRVLLRRRRRPGGRQHLRHRAAGRHAGRATAGLGHRAHGLGDRRRAAARAQPAPGLPGQPVAQTRCSRRTSPRPGGRNSSATSSGRTSISP